MTDSVQPTVSVVIPSHNRPQLLVKAVESVLAQDAPTEIIVIDDGSQPPVATDGVLADPAVQVIRNEPAAGPTRARNQGIDAATGRYIAFLDDDDVWLPGKLRACLGAAGSGPDGAVIAHRTADGVVQPSSGPPRSPEQVTDPVRRFGRSQTPHINSLLVEADLAKTVRFDESFGAAEDVDFVLELAKRRPFVLLPDVYAVRTIDNDTSIGIAARIAGRERLRAKHGDVIYADGPSRAFYHVRMGHLHLTAGSRGRALGSFVEALRHDPTHRGAWKGMVATAIPRQALRPLSSWNRGRKAAHG